MEGVGAVFGCVFGRETGRDQNLDHARSAEPTSWPEKKKRRKRKKEGKSGFLVIFPSILQRGLRVYVL
jgi:hypothetical protein